jgi:phosphatidate cytidylyltransferase
MKKFRPKKHGKGFFGGLFFSLVAAFVLNLYVHTYDFHEWMMLGALVSIMGTFGDLVESVWKRSFKIKDSGKILPGHGGFLDRFDSYILSVSGGLFV